MEFKKFSAGKKSYGKSGANIQIEDKEITNVNFEDPQFYEEYN